MGFHLSNAKHHAELLIHALGKAPGEHQAEINAHQGQVDYLVGVLTLIHELASTIDGPSAKVVVGYVEVALARQKEWEGRKLDGFPGAEDRKGTSPKGD